DHQLVAGGRQQVWFQQPLAGRIEEQQAVTDQSLQADFVEGGGTGPHRGGQPAVDLRMQAVRRGAIQHLVGSMLHFRVADGLQSDAVMGWGADCFRHTEALCNYVCALWWTLVDIHTSGAGYRPCNRWGNCRRFAPYLLRSYAGLKPERGGGCHDACGEVSVPGRALPYPRPDFRCLPLSLFHVPQVARRRLPHLWPDSLGGLATAAGAGADPFL